MMELRGWGAGTDRFGAFEAVFRALTSPADPWIVYVDEESVAEDLPMEEALARVRASLGPSVDAAITFDSQLVAKRSATRDTYVRDLHLETPGVRHGSCALDLCASRMWPRRMTLAVLVGERSVPADAAAEAIETQEDLEDFLVALCAPDEHKRIATGMAIWVDFSGEAPVEWSATYHAEAAEVARDLALSWIFLHDTSFVELITPLPLTTLAARVEAAPPGASVGISPDLDRAGDHMVQTVKTINQIIAPYLGQAIDPDFAARHGPRPRLPGDEELTREQVLAAIATPPSMLLEALEACAVPDAEWRAAEPVAQEILRATRAGAPTEKVAVDTNEHQRWLEQHAPYHVRRLPNGGVLLAGHPYKILWPLWAAALARLGIRPRN
jgi:hypothetical protein